MCFIFGCRYSNTENHFSHFATSLLKYCCHKLFTNFTKGFIVRVKLWNISSRVWSREKRVMWKLESPGISNATEEIFFGFYVCEISQSKARVMLHLSTKVVLSLHEELCVKNKKTWWCHRWHQGKRLRGMPQKTRWWHIRHHFQSSPKKEFFVRKLSWKYSFTMPLVKKFMYRILNNTLLALSIWLQ